MTLLISVGVGIVVGIVAVFLMVGWLLRNPENWWPHK